MTSTGLHAGLEAEHAAIFAYGAAGAHVLEELREQLVAAERVRRDRRDVLVALLDDAGDSVATAQPAYTLPVEVVDSESAAELVAAVNDSAATVWRAAVAQTSGDDRAQAVEAYADNAKLVARWRNALGEAPAAEAFPGRP